MTTTQLKLNIPDSNMELSPHPTLEWKRLVTAVARQTLAKRASHLAFTFRPGHAITETEEEDVMATILSNKNIAAVIYTKEYNEQGDIDSEHIHGLIQLEKTVHPSKSTIKTLKNCFTSYNDAAFFFTLPKAHLGWVVYMTKQSTELHCRSNQLTDKREPTVWCKKVVKETNKILDSLYDFDFSAFSPDEKLEWEIKEETPSLVSTSNTVTSKKPKQTAADRSNSMLESFAKYMHSQSCVITSDGLIFKHLGDQVYQQKRIPLLQLVKQRFFKEGLITTSTKEVECLMEIIFGYCKLKQYDMEDPNDKVNIGEHIDDCIVDIDYTIIRFKDFAIQTGTKNIITDNHNIIPTIHYDPTISLDNYEDLTTKFLNSDRPWVDVMRKNGILTIEDLKSVAVSQGKVQSNKQVVLSTISAPNCAKTTTIIDIKRKLFPAELCVDLTQEINKFFLMYLEGKLFAYSNEASELLGSKNELLKQFLASEPMTSESKGGSILEFIIQVLPILVMNYENMSKYLNRQVILDRLHLLHFTHTFSNRDIDMNQKVENEMSEDLYLIHLTLNRVLSGDFTEELPLGPKNTQEEIVEELKSIDDANKGKLTI